MKIWGLTFLNLRLDFPFQCHAPRCFPIDIDKGAISHTFSWSYRVISTKIRRTDFLLLVQLLANITSVKRISRLQLLYLTYSIVLFHRLHLGTATADLKTWKTIDINHKISQFFNRLLNAERLSKTFAVFLSLNARQTFAWKITILNHNKDVSTRVMWIKKRS